MVRESDTPENPDSESDDDESAPPRVVTGMMAKNGLADVLTYMDNQPSYAHRLPELLSIMKDLKTISQSTCSQSKISDFFYTLNHKPDKYDGFCYYTCMCVDKYVIG